MSRLITCIILLSVMTAGCITSVVYVNKITGEMLENIDRVEQAFDENNSEECVNSAKELSDKWDSVLKYNVLIIDLGHAVEITSAIAEIMSFAQEQNDELYAACDRVQAQLELFRSTQTPTIWKII